MSLIMHPTDCRMDAKHPGLASLHSDMNVLPFCFFFYFPKACIMGPTDVQRLPRANEIPNRWLLSLCCLISSLKACVLMCRMSRVIFIGNLPQDVREREVEDLFSKYGKIIGVSFSWPLWSRLDQYAVRGTLGLYHKSITPKLFSASSLEQMWIL